MLVLGLLLLLLLLLWYYYYQQCYHHPLKMLSAIGQKNSTVLELTKWYSQKRLIMRVTVIRL